MGSELKEFISSKDQTLEPVERESRDKDERPLLKSDSTKLTSSSLPSTPISAENLLDLEKKYAAYVRNDVYGTMGRGELPLVEKFLLGIAFLTLVPIRVVVGFVILILYYLICRFLTLRIAPNREDGQEDYAHMVGWRRVVIVQCGRFFSRAMLFTFGFYWINETDRSVDGLEESESKTECKKQSEVSERPGAIISNHVSYVDILYHMSSSFPSFVAKRSVAKLPLVGLISKCLGCVYVQRESKSSEAKGVSGVVTERVQEAHQNRLAPMMMLFPEGTTTNGDYLLPFKTGAFLSKVPVLPVILKYPYQRFSPAWDSITGVRHVILLLCQFVNHIEVTRLPVYHPSEQEKEDPRLYASNLRKLMACEGNLVMSDIGLPEKRIYHAALNAGEDDPIQVVEFGVVLMLSDYPSMLPTRKKVKIKQGGMTLAGYNNIHADNISVTSDRVSMAAQFMVLASIVSFSLVFLVAQFHRMKTHRCWPNTCSCRQGFLFQPSSLCCFLSWFWICLSSCKTSPYVGVFDGWVFHFYCARDFVFSI